MFCLVDIYMVLREAFAEWLKPLNASQLKLVTIYINRQLQVTDDSVPAGFGAQPSPAAPFGKIVTV